MEISSSDPPSKAGNARFTTVHLKPLSDQVTQVLIKCFFLLTVFSFVVSLQK